MYRALRSRCSHHRQGAVLPLVAVLLVALLGMAAFALDGGSMIEERRRLQGAADSAAYAAATDLFNQYPTNSGVDTGTAKTAAIDYALKNGYLNDAPNGGSPTPGTSLVTVVTYGAGDGGQGTGNYSGGPNVGTPVPKAYVEVTITYNVPQNFSTVWGTQDLNISARAVARGTYAPSAVGIMALHPTLTYSLKLGGSADLFAANGNSVIVNSTNGAAGSVQSSGKVQLTGTPVGKTLITGNTDTPSGFVPAAYTGTPPQPDPYSYLPQPEVPTPNRTAEITSGILNGATARTIYPGYYQPPSGGWNFNLNKGLTLAGEGATRPDGSVIQPGEAIYYFEGGAVRFNNGNAALTSAGGISIFMKPKSSLIYNPSGDVATSAAFAMNTDASMNLTPSTAGTYKGLTFFMDRTSQASVYISGNKAITAKGTWYMKKGHFESQANGGMAIGNLVADTIGINGGGDVVSDYNEPRASEREIRIVE